MKNAVYVFVIILLAALQTTVLSGVKFFGATADLLLAFVVFVALSDGALAGGTYGLLCGIIADALTVGRFGFNSLLMLYAGTFAGIFKEHFFHNNALVALLCSFLASFTGKLVYYLLFNYLKTGSGFAAVFFTKIIVGALLTAVATAIFYIINMFIRNKRERKGLRRRYGF